MKNLFISVFALIALAGCGGYYDYYKGGVRYTQDGSDCIYYVGEHGRNFSNYIDGMDNNKKIVYKNTRCEDLYASDTFGRASRQERQILSPVNDDCSCSACTARVEKRTCGCNTCNQPVLKRRYVIVSAM